MSDHRVRHALTTSPLPSITAGMRPWRPHWADHPAVRSGRQLTLGERAADKMRNGMGSWPFVGGFLLFMAVWAVVNTIVFQRLLHHHAFDPYPYILLNLFLSMLAGLQGAILLIAAKRSDQVASELAQHDYETNVRALARIEALHVRIAELLADNNKLLVAQGLPARPGEGPDEGEDGAPSGGTAPTGGRPDSPTTTEDPQQG